jgi:Transposase, Mutator family
LAVLTELRNRGVRDIFFLVCDGLKGLPDSVNAVFPLATVQTCIIHLIRNTFRYASRKYWDQISHDLRPIYTASTAADARYRFEEFAEKWGTPIRRSRSCGRAPGRSSSRSWTIRRSDPQSALLDECDRVVERPLPARHPGPRALPQRTVGDEDVVSGVEPTDVVDEDVTV